MVISVIIIVLIWIIFFSYEEELIVFNDRFAYRSGIFSLPYAYGKQYYFKDLKKVIYPVEHDVKGLPKKQQYKNNIDARNKIHIIFNNGEEELLLTSMRVNVDRAVEKINEQLGIRQF